MVLPQPDRSVMPVTEPDYRHFTRYLSAAICSREASFCYNRFPEGNDRVAARGMAARSTTKP
jgi:hypothetical protein